MDMFSRSKSRGKDKRKDQKNIKKGAKAHEMGNGSEFLFYCSSSAFPFPNRFLLTL